MHFKTSITKGNDWVANKTAIILSSMWLFWLIIIIFVAAYLIQAPLGAYQMVMFFISAFFQAIALPVLAFVSNIQGDRLEKKVDELQSEMLEEIKELKKLMAEKDAEDA